MNQIYLVAPVLNEAQNLPALLEGWESFAAACTENPIHAVVVDDGSRDGSSSLLAKMKTSFPLTVLSHQVTQGPGAAFATAFVHLSSCLGPDDLLITAEGDTTSRIDTLLTMVERLRREEIDVVLASPHAYGGGFSDTSAFRVLVSHCASSFAQGLLGLHGIHTTSSFFRVHRGSAILALQKKYGNGIVECAGFEMMVEMLIKIVKQGLSLSEVAMRLDTSRRQGKSKMKLWKTTWGYLRLALRKHAW